MNIAVILVNYNGWQDTVECVESLLQVSPLPGRIVVVDNGSTDDSGARLRQTLGRSIVLLETGKNLGFAGGVNIGLRLVLDDPTFDWFWILNNDTIVQPNSLKHLINRTINNPLCGIIGSTIRYYDAPNVLQTSGGGWFLPLFALSGLYGEGKPVAGYRPRPKELMPHLIYGASMFVSRKFIETVGLMSEVYFLYLEEVDWAIRGHRAGFRNAVAPESVIFHKQGRATGAKDISGARSLTADFYNIHSRLLITRRFYPYALPTVYLAFGVSILRRLLSGDRAGAIQVVKIILGRQDRPLES